MHRPVGKLIRRERQNAILRIAKAPVVAWQLLPDVDEGEVHKPATGIAAIVLRSCDQLGAEPAPLALRIDRAANDLNPFLLVVAIGLMVLNLTLYLGMVASRDPFVRTAAHQSGASATPASSTPTDPLGYGR